MKFIIKLHERFYDQEDLYKKDSYQTYSHPIDIYKKFWEDLFDKSIVSTSKKKRLLKKYVLRIKNYETDKKRVWHHT